MQPAEEVLQAYEHLFKCGLINIEEGFAWSELVFVHSKKSTRSLLLSNSNPSTYDETYCEAITLGPQYFEVRRQEDISTLYRGTYPRNNADVKNWILSQPYVKGSLVDVIDGTFWKFCTIEPSVSVDDLFWKIFDRSKVATDFEADVFDYVRDLYMNCEDPRKDPVYAKREELWQKLLLEYRIYKKRTIHVSELPGYSGNFISFQNVKDAIKKISC